MRNREKNEKERRQEGDRKGDRKGGRLEGYEQWEEDEMTEGVRNCEEQRREDVRRKRGDTPGGGGMPGKSL